MKRIIDYFLADWATRANRKALLLRGARQVGKTYAVRTLAKRFTHFLEVNLESDQSAQRIFEGTLDPEVMITALSALYKTPIIPGKTLLFLDEAQAMPRAIIALRYFYEKMPTLHIIAAGSLLDFAIEEIGVPVGRVEFLYLYPVSFAEYLAAAGYGALLHLIAKNKPSSPLNEALHTKAMGLLGEYMVVGGMPEAVAQWLETKDALGITAVHQSLLSAYLQDFSKYARRAQIKYVKEIFNATPHQLGHKFKYAAIEGEFRKRELAPALDLLVTANIATKVFCANGNPFPLAAGIQPQDYKVLFLDCGLAQTALGLDHAQWFIEPTREASYRGSLTEAFVGQELIAYASPTHKEPLYYWHKETRLTAAEIDYLIEIHGTTVPLEVKAGTGSTLRSLHTFLEMHPKSLYGIRFSSQNYSVFERIYSYPLYAVAAIGCQRNARLLEALAALTA